MAGRTGETGGTMNYADALRWLDYGVYLPFVARCPRAVAYALADRRGGRVMRSRPASLAAALDSLSRVFPEESASQREEWARRHYCVQSRDEMEAFWYKRPLSFFEEFVEISGLPLLREAVAEGKGVLLFSGHVGSTGLFFVVMGLHGFPLNIVGRPLDPNQVPLPAAVTAYAHKRVRGIETALGRPFLLTGRGNYPVMVEKLRQGETLMLLIDVVPTLLKRLVPIEFLGRPCLFGDGIASLHRATGARLLEWNIHQDHGTGVHRIEIRDPELGDVSDRTNQEIVQALANQVDRRIRLHPEDWIQWDSLIHFERSLLD